MIELVLIPLLLGAESGSPMGTGAHGSSGLDEPVATRYASFDDAQCSPELDEACASAGFVVWQAGMPGYIVCPMVSGIRCSGTGRFTATSSVVWCQCGMPAPARLDPVGCHVELTRDCRESPCLQEVACVSLSPETCDTVTLFNRPVEEPVRTLCVTRRPR